MIYLVQPPFIQLNSPYPSLYYLRSFLERRGYTAGVDDHSIALFAEIFSRSGLERIFADARRAWEEGKIPGAGHPHTRYNIERFLSEQTLWLSCIDRLVAFLRGQDGEWGRLLALANGVVPGGPRFDALLDSMNGDPPPNAAPLLAGRLLSDLADFLTVTLDPSFSLIRYAESLAAGRSAAGPAINPGLRNFPLLRSNLDGYIMKTFYRPFLERRWEALDAGELEYTAFPLILLVTIPFPGCLAGALVCAESAKRRFGCGTVTIAGGGYVNTELRFMEDGAFFDYFDFVSFDRGYGSLTAVLDFLRRKQEGAGPVPLYKTLYRSGGRIIRGTRISG
ncbi:MAG: radical SAM protein, partial [Treponema sp.]|nr:radical SAM protein [Treponema sp.]